MTYSGVNRRKGPDLIVRIYHKLTAVTTVVNILLVTISGIAKPRNVTMFDRFADSTQKGGWDSELYSYLIYLILFQFIISATGLFLNYTRHHRKRDSYSLLLGGSLIISVIAGIYLLV
ncbi:MAG: hypothetical protein PF637_09120 [Spirochaetes bacterium]|jgi:hypothetical protein|nr:hypothetical protein [Spirochaetota bacterium]